MERFFRHVGKEKTGVLPNIASQLRQNAFVAVVTMLVLRAIGSTLFGMILLKIVRGVVQVRSVSTALGVISATDAMSAILMQNLGGILVENTSIRILYFAMAGLMMLGMILTLFLRVQNTEKVFS